MKASPPWCRRTAAMAVVLTLAAGACRSSADDDVPSATVPTAPSTTTSTAPADPYAIPPTIDVAYVQRVFDALDQIRSEAVIDLLSKRQLTLEIANRLATVYNPEELEREVHAQREQLTRDLTVFRDPPGIRRTLVKRLLTARPDCISVEAEFDNSAVLKNPPPRTPTYLALQPTDALSDPENVNPTPFSIFSENKDFEDPCVAS